VSRTGSRVSRAARRELFRIFADSATRFGEDASLRYEELIIQAIRDLVENPQRIGARPVGARIHYHLRHSWNRVDGERVRDPRHLLVAKIVRTRLVVLAVVHDAMVEGLRSRIEEGEEG
jgi:toxin ParE1/3/4